VTAALPAPVAPTQVLTTSDPDEPNSVLTSPLLASLELANFGSPTSVLETLVRISKYVNNSVNKICT
jgi:hypothetical protein